MTPTFPTTKIIEAENTIPDQVKYITTQEFNKLITENVTARLRQGNLVNKIDFDNKLIRFSRNITSNKSKYL